MSSIDDHCKECEEKLGKPFREVHQYLDQYAKEMEGDMSHRKYFHHSDGVEMVRKKFGDESAKAAEIHIMMDFRTDYVPHRIEVCQRLPCG